MPPTDSLAHHFLDYVHFWVRCARFMRKFAPTKTFKTPSKSFKTTTKTIKRLQIPKTRSLCFLMFSAICKKVEMLSLLLLFCRVFTELCFWKKHGHDCKFEHCACVCAHHHADWDARLILWETIWNQAFSMSEIYNQFRGSGNDKKNQGCSGGHKAHDRFLEILTKTSTFWISVQKK